MQRRGDRGWPLRSGSGDRAPYFGRVDTVAFGVQRTPYPSRVSRVRNVETPFGSVVPVVAR